MLFLSGFELYPRWVPLIMRQISINVNARKKLCELINLIINSV